MASAAILDADAEGAKDPATGAWAVTVAEAGCGSLGPPAGVAAPEPDEGRGAGCCLEDSPKSLPSPVVMRSAMEDDDPTGAVDEASDGVEGASPALRGPLPAGVARGAGDKTAWTPLA
jgi:hypothetical protein